jgi:hypothetical protein
MVIQNSTPTIAYYNVHKSPTLVSILSHINPPHTLNSISFISILMTSASTKGIKLCIMLRIFLSSGYFQKKFHVILFKVCVDPLCWPCDTLYQLKLAFTSPASGRRSVGIVRLRTTCHVFFFFFFFFFVNNRSHDIMDQRETLSRTFNISMPIFIAVPEATVDMRDFAFQSRVHVLCFNEVRSICCGSSHVDNILILERKSNHVNQEILGRTNRLLSFYTWTI